MSFAACMADGKADIDMKTDLVWGLLRVKRCSPTSLGDETVACSGGDRHLKGTLDRKNMRDRASISRIAFNTSLRDVVRGIICTLQLWYYSKVRPSATVRAVQVAPAFLFHLK